MWQGARHTRCLAQLIWCCLSLRLVRSARATADGRAGLCGCTLMPGPVSRITPLIAYGVRREVPAFVWHSCLFAQLHDWSVWTVHIKAAPSQAATHLIPPSSTAPRSLRLATSAASNRSSAAFDVQFSAVRTPPASNPSQPAKWKAAVPRAVPHRSLAPAALTMGSEPGGTAEAKLEENPAMPLNSLCILTPSAATLHSAQPLKSEPTASIPVW